MDNKETSEFKNLKHQLLAAVLFNFVSKIKDTFYALPKTFYHIFDTLHGEF